MDNQQLNLFEGDYYEDPKVKETDLENLQFKVHTSLIYKLGEELIKDEVTAISELVKNAYDADSPYVELTVSPHLVTEYEDTLLTGEIIVKDEGCGMDKKDIVNGWLTLSNSFKKKMKKEKRVTTKYERMPLGDKGLGRLAVQKLGKIMFLITKKEFSNIEYTVTIPWGDFRKNTTLENINIISTERIINTDIEKGYTKIVIRDLVNPTMWTEEKNVLKLEQELSQTVSPFKKESNFYVFAKVGERELDFSKITKDILDASQSRFSFKVNREYVDLSGYFKIDSLLQKDHKDFDCNEDHLLEFIKLYKNELPNVKVTPNNLFPIEFEEKIKIIHIGDLKTTDRYELIYPGDYEGEIYSYSLRDEYLRKQVSNLNFKVIKDAADLKLYVKQNYGIKIFRDDFAILPYGYGEGGDWLSLNKSQSTSGKFSDLKNDTIIGFIQLYGKDSYNLREKTNREGLIEDNYYKNFYLINKYLINRINRNIQRIREKFNEYINSLEIKDESGVFMKIDHEVALEGLKKVSEKSNILEKNINHVDSIVNKSVIKLKQTMVEIEKIKNISLEDKNKIQLLIKELNDNISLTSNALQEAKRFILELQNTKQYLITLEQDYTILLGRMQEITELAGLGIMVETMTHELYTLINSIKSNTTNIINYYNLDNLDSQQIKQYFNYIRHSSEAMRKQLGHLSPNFRNVRTKKNKIRISELLNEHVEYYTQRAENKKIKIDLKISEDFLINVSIGMLNQVLDNLYLNSEYWLNHARKLGEIQNPTYFIEVISNGKIIFYDNGLGIDENIARGIFDPFVSNKEDGRGLGLYIVSQILEYHHCKIRLMRERNKFDHLFKFELDLRKSIILEEK